MCRHWSVSTIGRQGGIKEHGPTRMNLYPRDGSTKTTTHPPTKTQKRQQTRPTRTMVVEDTKTTKEESSIPFSWALGIVPVRGKYCPLLHLTCPFRQHTTISTTSEPLIGHAASQTQSSDSSLPICYGSKSRDFQSHSTILDPHISHFPPFSFSPYILLNNSTPTNSSAFFSFPSY